MRRELHAEWTKTRTAPGTAWLLSAVVVLTAAASAAVAATVSCPATGCDQDVAGSASPESRRVRRPWPSWPYSRSAGSTAPA
ncbi:hypothetical protein [Microbispora sp. GKU 823]|uniref:hypothetical protein n=1 Tax=Microbispora sp. GKU 823 TaxID=1652100 RepID=UPI002117D2A3|nr:hypothetical protein [Microbispora sp. GKU 823]